jgi:photosystem II stability/assembly factor-like uncharacterized protein
MKSNRIARRSSALFLMAALASIVGCHRESEWEPLAEQKIYVADKFFDVHVADAKRALVIGYGGKIIETIDGGFSWGQVASGTDRALYSIDFANDGKTGWIVGQQGLVMKTLDGGKTWAQQEAEPWLDSACKDPKERLLRPEDKPCQFAYLFAVSVIDDQNVAVIGDKSTYMRTRDGGKTWEARTLTFAQDDVDADLMLAFEDPVLYDVSFLDANNGYIVGEFGKIYHTTDGGETWAQQQESVMDDSVLDILDLPTLFDVEFSDSQHGIVCGLDGRIAVTEDGGNDWNFVQSNVAEYIDPFYSATILPNGVRWVVGSSGQVVVAPPGGQFAKGNLGSEIYSWIRRVRFLDDKVGWLVGGFGLVMSTDDGGKTWYRRIG